MPAPFRGERAGIIPKPAPRAQGGIFKKIQGRETGLSAGSAPLRRAPAGLGYFIIAAATFLNALTSFSMNSRVYVGCVQNEIVASASECATGQLTFV